MIRYKAVRRFGRIGLVLFLAIGLLGIAACDDSRGDRPIAIYGDSQRNENIQAKVVEAITRVKPAIIFRVGDIVNDGDSPSQWKDFRKIHAPLLKITEYYPCLGNHEKDSPLYFKNFPIVAGRRWYSLERRGIHFIILDSNSNLKPGSEQYKWLESDLKKVRPETRFKIVLFHHPIFNVGQHQEDEKSLRPAILPLFIKFGVYAVFSGHDHNYARFNYEGIYFVVTGGGGSYLVEQARQSPYLEKFIKNYHFCVIYPDEDYLKIKVFDVDLNLIDEWEIRARKLTYARVAEWQTRYFEGVVGRPVRVQVSPRA